MSIETPTWTPALWNDLKNRRWVSPGGWLFEGEEDQVGFLVIDNGLWGMDYEPAPDPDPPNDSFPMVDEAHWDRISGGELIQSTNCIRKQGDDFQVQAVTDRTRYSQVVSA